MRAQGFATVDNLLLAVRRLDAWTFLVTQNVYLKKRNKKKHTHTKQKQIRFSVLCALSIAIFGHRDSSRPCEIQSVKRLSHGVQWWLSSEQRLTVSNGCKNTQKKQSRVRANGAESLEIVRPTLPQMEDSWKKWDEKVTRPGTGPYLPGVEIQRTVFTNLCYRFLLELQIEEKNGMKWNPPRVLRVKVNQEGCNRLAAILPLNIDANSNGTSEGPHHRWTAAPGEGVCYHRIRTPASPASVWFRRSTSGSGWWLVWKRFSSPVPIDRMENNQEI